jgi:uncharacterized iron-regulated membrane protein
VRLLRLVHRWLGLLLALVVFAVAASGGLLLLRDPYYRFVHPSLGEPADPGARAAVLTRIERDADAAVRLVKLPRDGMNVFQVWYADDTEAFVHARTGDVIDRWHPVDRLPAFLFELHAHLLAEPNGTLVNGFVALFVLFMALTGIVLWWPARRGAFRLRRAVPRHAGPGEILRSHAAVGALAALPIAVFVGTGAAIVFYDDVERVVTAVMNARPAEEPDAHVAPRSEARRPWSQLLQALDRTFPEGQAVFYYPGTGTNARLMFRKRLPGEWHPNGRSYVLIDPYSSAVVQAIDARAQGAGTRLMHAVYPVHAAKVGGVAMTLVAALAALALAWLSVGGAWAYVGRRVSRTRRLGRSLAA